MRLELNSAAYAVCLKAVVENLSHLPYFPKDNKDGLLSFVKACAVFISSPEDFVELCELLAQSCGRWPSALDARRVWCDKHEPADGIEPDQIIAIEDKRGRE